MVKMENVVTPTHPYRPTVEAQCTDFHTVGNVFHDEGNKTTSLIFEIKKACFKLCIVYIHGC